MKWASHLIQAAGICAAMAVAGCADKTAEQPAAPVKTEEQLRQEAEAAQRQQETAALAERRGQLAAAARVLQGQPGGGEVVPAALEQSVGALAAPLAEAERLLGALEQAADGDWEAARQRLDTALGELEAARATAAAAASAWAERQAEAAAAAGEGVSRVDPKTGLIEGLDGGQYEPYLVSVVERTQRALRRTGHYAGPVDGDLDLATMEVVARFQSEKGLQKSGVPSPMTRALLFAGA